MQVTTLFYDGRRINRIVIGSRFKTIPRAKTSTPEEREAICENLIAGWVHNAGYDRKLFTIVHSIEKPLPFHPTTVEMMK